MKPNVEIMRAFVRLGRMVIEHSDLAARLDRLERDYDAKLKVVFDAIRQLMLPPADPARPRIGFHGGTGHAHALTGGWLSCCSPRSPARPPR